ncbi:ROK family transcriptional regulator [Agromyces aerolatus]|uniref:ROK family transcriptional regulator n=1 Tax=Agromyces sp. LY-1074 TaxID=3074080 RepID=UPI00285B0A69|nr:MULTISPECIES: ROK family transcriptional regulator [unclassified Agromyces]MDR5698287.1 ROK family transcriptional regulator [Agromyces sp. LY-1074]MDR5704581.1 ROK family transcriptional regulator [Agromyces sp. LY-1358]
MTTTADASTRALRPRGKVLPEHARRHNRSLVLQTLYSAGPRSRADVARETGLTRVTVSDLVAALIAEGLVTELGPQEAGRPGKPATLIDIDRAAFQILGLDLSEHDLFRGAVMDLDGQVVARAEIALDGATGPEATARVVTLAERLAGLATAPVLGAGVGSPGVVDPAGVVRSAPNLGWHDEPLQHHVASVLGVPVHVANDANVAVLAEHGESDGRDLLLVKIGHGVGAGLIIGGRPVVGDGYAAGEIGHVVVGTDRGPRCACGKDGCLEAWVAVPRLTAQLAEIDLAGGEASARDDLLREAGRRLGIVLAPVVGALNLAEVVLSGPVELLDGAFHDAAVDTLRDRTMAEQHRGLRLRMTEHGQDIVLRGAAVMVLSGQLGVS